MQICIHSENVEIVFKKWNSAFWKASFMIDLYLFRRLVSIRMVNYILTLIGFIFNFQEKIPWEFPGVIFIMYIFFMSKINNDILKSNIMTSIPYRNKIKNKLLSKKFINLQYENYEKNFKRKILNYLKQINSICLVGLSIKTW